MINVIVKWQQGSPESFKPGQLIVYKDGSCELIGWDCSPSYSEEIVKYTTLIEAHELEWLQSMAAERSLGVLK